jgi:hypothetical protein
VSVKLVDHPEIASRISCGQMALYATATAKSSSDRGRWKLARRNAMCASMRRACVSGRP